MINITSSFQRVTIIRKVNNLLIKIPSRAVCCTKHMHLSNGQMELSGKPFKVLQFPSRLLFGLRGKVDSSEMLGTSCSGTTAKPLQRMISELIQPSLTLSPVFDSVYNAWSDGTLVAAHLRVPIISSWVPHLSTLPLFPF